MSLLKYLSNHNGFFLVPPQSFDKSLKPKQNQRSTNMNAMSNFAAFWGGSRGNEIVEFSSFDLEGLL